MSQRSGFNLIGYASGNLGVGLVLRQFAKALLANGHAVAIVDLDAGGGRSGHDMSLSAHFVPRLEDGPHDINIWIIGADQLVHIAPQLLSDTRLQKMFNAVFLWWELPEIPPLWVACANVFDVVITGSEFVHDAWAKAVAEVPVLMAPHPLELPEHTPADRARFGLDPQKLLFYTGFEATSDPSRKNPFAAVSAFIQAFGNRGDVGLVIKVNNPEADGSAAAGLRKLKDAVASDSRVVLLFDKLAYADLLSLYASCDVIVSLHRAEGLGLIPLEAMRLGKPVIATGWSGNMTYMNHTNAALVKYKVVPIEESAFRYAPTTLGIQAHWADPVVEHAGALMRKLADTPALRQQLAAAAKTDSLAYQATAQKTLFADELLMLFNTRSTRRAKDFAALGRAITAEQVRGKASIRAFKIRQQGLPLRFFSLCGEHLKTHFSRHVGWRLAR
jgi:glycosyltransferase involved in cell wall biosynthesis